MAADLTELTRTIEKLGATDRRREALTEYRDRQMAHARDEGITWRQLREITGLSVRGAQLAVERGRRA